jgi:uncharacterized protein YjbJ (UPF0337 family)
MGGNMDEMMGRAKEAIGDVTDDDSMKAEGKADRAAGGLKNKLDDAKKWAEDKIDDARD